jgi:hypothetical protein
MDLRWTRGTFRITPPTPSHPKKRGGITPYPLNYPLIFIFTSKVTNMILNPPKLSNCGNLTTLTFFSQNAPITFLKRKKKNPKNKRKKKPNEVAGHPQAGCLGATEPPPVA